MKKKIFSIIAAFVFVLAGSLCLTACGDPKQCDVKVEQKTGEYDYVMFKDEQADLMADMFQVEEGKNFYKTIILRGNYNPDTLKFYNNGSEVAWTKDESLDANASFNEDYVKVGTLSLSNVKSDITLKYEAEEKQVKFTFAATAGTDAQVLDQKRSMLEAFKLQTDTSKNLYSMINEGYYVEVPYSQRQNKINFVCDQKIGYYDVNGLTSQFTPNFTNANTKTYSLQLSSNDFLQKENKIELNVAGLDYSYLSVNNNNVHGNYLEMAFDGTDKESVYQSNIQSKTLKLTLNKVSAGVDYSNFKVYINDIEIPHDFNSDTTCTINLTGKLPIDYIKNISEINSGDYVILTNFNITTTPLTITNDAQFCKVNIESESDIDYQTNLFYYVDKQNNIGYATNNKDEGIYIQFNKTSGSTLTISLDSTNYNISVQDLVNHVDVNTDWLNQVFGGSSENNLILSVQLVGEDSNQLYIGFKVVPGKTYGFTLA